MCFLENWKGGNPLREESHPLCMIQFKRFFFVTDNLEEMDKVLER